MAGNTAFPTPRAAPDQLSAGALGGEGLGGKPGGKSPGRRGPSGSPGRRGHRWELLGASWAGHSPVEHGVLQGSSPAPTAFSRTGSLPASHTLNSPLLEPWRSGVGGEHGVHTASRKQRPHPRQGAGAHFLVLEAKGQEGVQERAGLETGREGPPPRAQHGVCEAEAEPTRPRPALSPGEQSPDAQAAGGRQLCERWSPVVRWLRLHTPRAGGLGSIPGRGTRVHMLQLRSGAAS